MSQETLTRHHLSWPQQSLQIMTHSRPSLRLTRLLHLRIFLILDRYHNHRRMVHIHPYAVALHHLYPRLPRPYYLRQELADLTDLLPPG